MTVDWLTPRSAAAFRVLRVFSIAFCTSIRSTSETASGRVGSPVIWIEDSSP